MSLFAPDVLSRTCCNGAMVNKKNRLKKEKEEKHACGPRRRTMYFLKRLILGWGLSIYLNLMIDPSSLFNLSCRHNTLLALDFENVSK